MKTANNNFNSLRYFMLTVVIMLGMVTIIASNGDGDGGGGGNGNPNSLLSGDYQIHKVEYESDNFIAQRFDGTADGDGNFNTDIGSIAYSISDDRTVYISIPSQPSVEKEYGMVSSNGNLMMVTDAQLVDPNNQNDVETVFAVKKSTNMTAAMVSGEYIVSQVGRNSNGFYAGQILVVLQSDGTGTWLIQNHSQPAEVGLSGNLTFTGASNGTFTVNKDAGPDSGIVSPDASLFVLTDGDPNDGDQDAHFAVGVRKSTTAPTLSGSFQLHFIGYDPANAYPTGPQFAARWTVVENAVNFAFDATSIVDSRGIAPGTTVAIPHTSVAMDGTFTAGPDSTDLSILSPDGSFFAAVETDTAVDSEIKIGLAIK